MSVMSVMLARRRVSSSTNVTSAVDVGVVFAGTSALVR